MADVSDVSYLSQDEAIAVDEELMGPLGFSVDQLMELAGLSVACSLAAEYPAQSHRRVLVMAGPGNNGGDGLVAGRHLHHFGYTVEICYPKRTDKPVYHGLVQQCTSLGIPFLEADDLKLPLRTSYDVVLDAMFGFSFRGAPRPPFDAMLDSLRPAAQPPALVSVDIPSGWHVENGDEQGDGIRPDMLVSLTAPKRAAKLFQGAHHYLGGRFVPPAIRDKYGLKLPEYPGTSMCVRFAGVPRSAADMRVHYDQGALDESTVLKDPIQQFEAWFDEAALRNDITEPNAMAVASASPDGKPSVRMVLLKSFDKDGFVFYTNFSSRKADELLSNPHAAMTVHWAPLQRSVRVEGSVERVPNDEAEAYFRSRPRGSQLGAWASQQSSVIASRQTLEEEAAALADKYADESLEIPKPPFWGGFRIVPTCIEFWQGRESRLHDRIVFRRGNGDWTMQRLSP